jgi:hypothetical protein
MTLTDCIKVLRVADDYDVHAFIGHKDDDGKAGFTSKNVDDLFVSLDEVCKEAIHYSDCSFYVIIEVEDDHVCHIEKSLASAIKYIVMRSSKNV